MIDPVNKGGNTDQYMYHTKIGAIETVGNGNIINKFLKKTHIYEIIQLSSIFIQNEEYFLSFKKNRNDNEVKVRDSIAK